MLLGKGTLGDAGWVCEALLGIRVKQRGYKCVCCHVSSCDPEEDMFLSLTHTHTHTHTTREARRFISFLSSRCDLIFVFSLTSIRPLGARTSPAEMNEGEEEVGENKETFIVI